MEEDPIQGSALQSRRYTDQEVTLVIKRAAELQAQESERIESRTSGLSLGELEQVAREAGLDPALVRRAATELDTRNSTAPHSQWVGAPTVITIERTVQGEVSTDEYEAIVEEIRRAFNDNGFVSTLGRSLAWTSLSDGAGRRRGGHSINITVSPRNGNTVIRAEESLRGVAGGLFGGLMGGIGGGTTGASIGVGLGVFHSAVIAGGMWASIFGGSYLLARTIFGRLARRRGDRLRAVVDRIAEHVAATASIAAPSQGQLR
jgi:hypothetical protein